MLKQLRQSYRHYLGVKLSLVTGVLLLLAQNAHAIVIDPGLFPDNTDLTNAFAGVTLTVSSPYVGAFVTNSTPPGAPTFFIQRFGLGGSLDETWTDDPGFTRMFRADFSVATDFVAIDMYNDSNCVFGPGDCIGTLQAYDSGDSLLETVVTPAIGDSFGAFERAMISRDSNDIAYILAFGSGLELPDGGVRLTRLEFNEHAPEVLEPGSLALLTLGLLGLGLTKSGKVKLDYSPANSDPDIENSYLAFSD